MVRRLCRGTPRIWIKTTSYLKTNSQRLRPARKSGDSGDACLDGNVQRGGGRCRARRSKREQIKLDGTKAKLHRSFPAMRKGTSTNNFTTSWGRTGGGPGGFGGCGGGGQQISAPRFFLRAKTKEEPRGEDRESVEWSGETQWSGVGGGRVQKPRSACCFCNGNLDLFAIWK
jgi:hypothetical protein